MRRTTNEAPPPCLGRWEDATVVPGLEEGQRCGVAVCAWAFECVNGAVTVVCESCGPQGECGRCPNPDACREAPEVVGLLAMYAERRRRKTAFIPPFAGMVVVTDEHDSRYACFGNDENFCLKGEGCPMHRDCCRMAGMVDDGVAVVLRED